VLTSIYKNKILILTSILVGFFFLVSSSRGFAEEEIPADTENVSAEETAVVEDKVSSKEIVRRAWEASGRRDLEQLSEIVDQCLEVYGPQAKELHGLLTGFPIRGEEEEYSVLNAVGTCVFIQAEALMNNGKTEEAVVLFKEAMEEYKWAQAWDPSRGAYWSIAEKSQASIDVLSGKVDEEVEEKVPSVKSMPTIKDKGTEEIIDYTKYGEFVGVGTEDYAYKIKDPKGLSAAIGEGVYPNAAAVFKDPRYRELRGEGRLKGKHWDFINTDDLEASYYKWISAPESSTSSSTLPDKTSILAWLFSAIDQ